jgi:hypothetical protein
MKLNTLIAGLLTILPGLAPAMSESEMQALLAKGKVYRTPQGIKIDGPINFKSPQRFKELLGKNDTTVILDSPGGITSAALDIAEIIQERKLNVVVDGTCLSSCANYLFLAGNKKSAKKFSLVGFHGSEYGTFLTHFAHQKDIQKRDAEEFLREVRFLDRGKVSYDVVLYGGLMGLYCGNDLQHKACKTIAQKTWYPSRQDLAQAGVQGLDDFWHPGNPKALEKALEINDIPDKDRHTTEKIWTSFPAGVQVLLPRHDKLVEHARNVIRSSSSED